MKKIHLIYSGLLCIVSSVLFYACETTELDLTENPNALNPDEANTDFFLNAIQEDFAELVHFLGESGAQVTRIVNMGTRQYREAYAATDFDVEWELAYRQVLNDIKAMNAIAGPSGQNHHVAMGQVFEAYTIVSMVDFFGDVPYSEALQGLSNLNPKVDKGSDIYDAALDLLDAAIRNFEEEPTMEPAVDLYYDGDWDKWIDLANTLKMKIYLQRRLVDGDALDDFNAIVTSGNFIQDASGDFQFNWGTSIANPVTRHPHYVDNYTPTGASDYMSNWFMDYMQSDKVGNEVDIFEEPDPRIQYYFYRQTATISTNPNDIRCIQEDPPKHYMEKGVTVFCSLENGYWGRDHGDDAGIPPDTQSRTTYGVYPVGGKFDDRSFSVIASVDVGAQGAGITPVMLSSWVDFMRAEMALFASGEGSAQAFIESGIAKSIAKVRSFAALDATADLSREPALALDAAYISEVGTLFASADEEEKKNILAKEYFVALFGNGIDAYNFYRRTGTPTDIQPNLEANPGGFIRSFFYPASLANRNASVNQKDEVTSTVFWDNNPTTGFPVGN